MPNVKPTHLHSQRNAKQRHKSTNSKVLKRADWAMRYTTAFKDVVARGNRSRRDTIHSLFKTWAHKQKDKIVHKLKSNWYDYRVAKPGCRKYAATVAANSNRDEFDFHPTHPTRHLEIRDRTGRLIAYRLRIPSKFTDELDASSVLIPKKKPRNVVRFKDCVNRHWALWKMYDKTPTISKEFRQSRDAAEAWFRRNQELFDHLSHILRMLDPYMYDKFMRSSQNLPEGCRMLCGAWAGCAINQFQTTDANPHVDCNDYGFGYNVVTGWGTFTSSKLLLCEIKQSIEMVPGDAVFFLGRGYTHYSVDVVGGVRNVIDCFHHEQVMKYTRAQRGQTSAKIPAWKEKEWDAGILDGLDDDESENEDENENEQSNRAGFEELFVNEGEGQDEDGDE